MKKIPKKVGKNLNISKENSVYIKLEYDESVESKRNILSSELSLLNILKIIKRYSILREEELRLKVQMYKSVRDLDFALRKTKSSFPFLKIPQRAKREEISKKEAIIPKEIMRKEVFDKALESQLKIIQDKLKSISS